MAQIEILKEGQTVLVDLQPLKGKYVKKGQKMMLGIADVDDDRESIKRINEYNDYVESLAAKISGFSVEELDELDVDEKNKFVNYVQEKVDDSINFLKSSSLVGNSKQRVTRS